MTQLDGHLLTARQVAEYLSVERSWVYEHATELGAIRLGAGPRARLRFDADTITERLANPQRSGTKRTPRRRPTPQVTLLPIKRRTLE